MAAGAVRFVGRELPGDDFIVVGVATAAHHAGTVRDIANGDVGIRNRRCPRGGAMARVAGFLRDEMAGRFASRCGAVVAGVAAAGSDLGMAERCRCPRRGAMALIARGSGWQVIR